ncbi:hypothetical protein MMC25_002069 [Agyrium rufum]|nr:hypothetical protein [Agyrium rufum]
MSSEDNAARPASNGSRPVASSRTNSFLANGSTARARSQSPHPTTLGKHKSAHKQANGTTNKYLKNGEKPPRASIDTISGLSDHSQGDVSPNGRIAAQEASPYQPLAYVHNPQHSPWRNRLLKIWQPFWIHNKGLIMVLVAELFGALMTAGTRLLEIRSDEKDPEPMHPFQILFFRMGITAVISQIYMWWTKMPDAPFGKKGIRWLLICRGLSGFFGVYGLYFSLIYLPLAEATVLTFLSPIVSNFVCSFVLKEPFTRKEVFASMVSLFGVVFIARPTALFSHAASSEATDGAVPPPAADDSHSLSDVADVTPVQRLIAIGVAMIGVLGAGGAYTFIRWIGHRAHPLISVNYYSTWCTLVSLVAMLVIPSVNFRAPALREWGLLVFIGTFGFMMQFLLTAGLSYEKSSRATMMVYSQMLFALAFDRIVWGVVPGLWSWVGCGLILGSTVYVALVVRGAGGTKAKGKDEVQVGSLGRRDEEAGLMGPEPEDEDHEEYERIGGSNIPLKDMRSER